MNSHHSNPAFGAPGLDPRWTSSAKDGVGTAYSTSSKLWFTLSHGIVNEIYFPHVDTPNTRDLQLLVTDGESFVHEEKRDFDHRVEYPERNTLLYRLTNTARDGRYRIVKEVLGEPHSAVLLMHTRIEVLDPALRGRLRVYLLLAPHVKGAGAGNSAEWIEEAGCRLLHAWRDNIHLVLGCTANFARRSVGYVAESDGWRDLMENRRLTWEFDRADRGNIALIGEVACSPREECEFTVGVGFGFGVQSASTQLLQAFATPFAQVREKYVAQWRRAAPDEGLAPHTGDGGSMARLSECVLRAHEDKLFPGASVASLSIPWGETKDDRDRGGYHLVWTRDMVHTATALLACGETESPLRALIWLACVQAEDGGLPQNSSISGEAYWKGIQLDEVAVPILLAWRLREARALRRFDPWTTIARAVRYLVAHGPVTAQERWEENSGYSPSTLAVMISALVCAAEFARERGEDGAAEFALGYADWLEAHVDEWTATRRGDLVPGKPRHYLRITPAGADGGEAGPDPDNATVSLANGGGTHLARRIVGGDFLELVRLGVRAPDAPLVLDSVAVIDAVLRRELPQGPGWRRYNFDGYGQKADGSAFDGAGEGRSWPLLTGERGHYELCAGRDPLPLIRAMEGFANHGGMLPEQVWDADDLPEAGMRRGAPTGSAMPLCWAHAEYLSLVRSRRDGRCFARIEPAHARYVRARPPRAGEMWTFGHRLRRIPRGSTLRLIAHAPATVRWSADGWATMEDVEARDSGLGCWFADLATGLLAAETRIEFTFRWAERWEGRNFSVDVAEERRG